MTRKHFEAIAKAILLSAIDDTSKLVVASNIAGELAEFNERFDAGRFISAATGRTFFQSRTDESDTGFVVLPALDGPDWTGKRPYRVWNSDQTAYLFDDELDTRPCR